MTTNTNAAPDLKTVINFLMGECTLNGFQFGETPEGAGKYWWRAELRRAALSTAARHRGRNGASKGAGVTEGSSDPIRTRVGEKSSPSDATLAKLGMKRVITFERIQQPIWQATEIQPRTKSG